ncbi:MAG TPA: NUDIX hydrolase [Rhodocyclaceae bacterium]
MDLDINYCSVCGGATALQVPPGDTALRKVCPHCGAIHYRNPKMVVGTLPVWQEQVLLCRRAIEPRHGLWTLPAGFMELGESVEQGALRETREEANTQPLLDGLYTLISAPDIGQVMMFFRARLQAPEFSPGVETLETRLFREEEIPWEQLAFRSVEFTLKAFFADRRRGAFGLHSHEIRHPR